MWICDFILFDFRGAERPGKSGKRDAHGELGVIHTIRRAGKLTKAVRTGCHFAKRRSAKSGNRGCARRPISFQKRKIRKDCGLRMAASFHITLKRANRKTGNPEPPGRYV